MEEKKRRQRKQRQTTTRRKFRKTYFREWRMYRDLTLEAAAEQIGDYLREHEYATGYTYATLGRLERGLIGYTQMVLEAMAHIYRTDEPSLITRDPDDSEGMWAIWQKMQSADRRKLVEIAKTLSEEP
ncbi:helix-turn-helix transcriptional regulator [Bradyrhizobium sp. Ai1a-2]|uniref:helix-turn-helix domain-containing protein n=1 Tax=Bradyrhizobium sp. Ai1a-2 TaxID=196490 RepID=UPI000405DA4C|nr:helix-turn-helix transcriptional regulator [Bradyrhizobium sp. Ai1a-2]